MENMQSVISCRQESADVYIILGGGGADALPLSKLEFPQNEASRIAMFWLGDLVICCTQVQYVQS
jgi:hypothetical protein